MLLLVTSVFVGCDSGPKIVPVKGLVLRDGKPVANASVTFFPNSGRPSYATSDAEGKYSLEYGEGREGAVVGEHTVKLTLGGSMPGAPTGASGRGRQGGGFTPPQEVTLPTTVTVGDQASEIDLEVPDA